MAGVIEALLPLNPDDAAFMRTLSDVSMKNWNGIEVGTLRAASALRNIGTPLGGRL
jgi:hypothetical protein